MTQKTKVVDIKCVLRLYYSFRQRFVMLEMMPSYNIPPNYIFHGPSVPLPLSPSSHYNLTLSLSYLLGSCRIHNILHTFQTMSIQPTTTTTFTIYQHTLIRCVWWIDTNLTQDQYRFSVNPCYLITCLE